MAGVSKTSLGAWEDMPRRLGTEDMTRLSVDASDAFVLTRVDGRTSIADLCTVTGLGERKTLAALERLIQAELIVVVEHVGPRKLIKLRRKAARSQAVSKETYEPFFGVQTDLARWLTRNC